ncbi:MAG: SusC/RagA family TonB-linked outer membrane protein [Ginsengibacter sp.]
MRKFITTLTGLLCLFHIAIAQTHNVTGKVIDSRDGLPIPDATIKIKGAKDATITDKEGNFSLRSSTTQASLIVSSVGYSTKTFNASTGTTANIALDVDVRSLNEIVVTGVGTATSKKKLGISVESISADRLPPVPTASIDQALVGKIPGAQIQSIDGTPGARADIILRGINTIQGGTKPLILLDGVEVFSTDINSLDLTSIERVEVVQGAASATLYGAQGANGVIQLFSRKGKRGAPSINVSSNYSIDQYLNIGNVHKARKHTYKTDADNNLVDANGDLVELDENGIYQGVRFANSAGAFPSAQLNPANIYNKEYNKNLKYYDQFSQMFANGYSRNNNLNIAGAGERMDYSFAFSNNKQESAIRDNGYVDRSNFSTNVGAELFKGFKVRSITQLVYTKNTLNPYYSAGRNSIFEMLNTAPFYDLNQKLPDGIYPFYLGNDISTQSVNGYNPKYYFDYVQGRDYTVDIFQNLQANFVVNKFLELDAKYGINHTREDNNWLYKDQSQNVNIQYEQDWAYNYNGDDPNGEIDNFNYKNTGQNFIASAFIKTDFQKDFHSKLPITTSTQFSYDYRKTKFSQYITYGKHLQPYAVYNLNQTASQAVASDYVEPFVTYGFLVNQKIDFGDYGGISGGLRSDFSSAFGRGSKAATFPRGDAYIRLSSFKFWRQGIDKTISEFKLRVAYGEAGIQPRPFDRYITLSPGNVGTGLSFNLPSTVNNPDLRVEISKEFEVGTDIAITGFKGQWLNNVNISATYWHRKGEDVIYDVSAAPSTGAVTNKNNAIFLSSKGLQASLNLSVFRSSLFNYDFTANFGKQTSKIDKIIGGDIILTTSAGSTSLVLTAGQKIGQIFGYKAFTSLDQTRKDGSLYIDKADQGKYQLANGYVVDTASKVIQFTNETYPLGTGTPKFNMSFINAFSYKDIISLNFQVDWVYGNYLYNQTKEWMYRDGIHGDYDDEVTINGVTAAYSAFHRSAYASIFGAPNGSGRNGTKDYFLEDASFVRLRNVSLGIDIAKLTPIKYFKRLQLVFSGRNIWTATKYSGFDPEISSGSSTYSSFDRGIDHNSMPNIKSYQVGLNVGF